MNEELNQKEEEEIKKEKTLKEKEQSRAFVYLGVSEIFIVAWMTIALTQIEFGTFSRTTMYVGILLAIITMIVQIIICKGKIQLSIAAAMVVSSPLYVLLIYFIYMSQ